MAEDEKHNSKKYKVVAEEVNPVEVAEPEEAQEEKITEAPVEEVKENEPLVEENEGKHFLGVAETDNIDSNLKSQEKGVFFKFFLVTFFATLLALLLAGGMYVYLTGNGKALVGGKTATSATPAPSTAPSPTDTPAPNVDPSTFKVSVLNGNGGIGVAGAVKTIIEKIGFKVSNLGNADNFNFTDTLIQVKSSVPAGTVAQLKNALTANYSIKIGDALDSSSAYDIVITVGSK